MALLDVKDALAWPRLDARVWLALDCCPSTGHAVRSAGLAGTHLFVTEPCHESTESASLEPGASVVMGWATPTGYFEIEAAFVATHADDRTTWEFEPTGVAERLERRRFGRAPCALPARISIAGRDPVAAIIVDIGEDGLRCAMSNDVAAPESGELTISFRLGDHNPTVESAVAWWSGTGDGQGQAGLRLMSVDTQTAELIRSHIFRLQLEDRRRMREIEGRRFTR